MYTNSNSEPQKVNLYKRQYSNYRCSEDEYIDYSFSYSVAERQGVNFVLRNNGIEVNLTPGLMKKYHCTKNHPDNNVLYWNCQKEDGTNLFSTEQNMVEKKVSVTMSFGTDFLLFDDTEYPFIEGGQKTKYCSGGGGGGDDDGDGDSAGSIILIVIIVLIIIAIVWCCKQ